MQRLIEILSGYCYPVLEAPGNRLPGRVNHSQRGVAILDGFGDYSHGHEVVNLIDVYLLTPELLIDRIQPFDAAFDVNDLDA